MIWLILKILDAAETVIKSRRRSLPHPRYVTVSLSDIAREGRMDAGHFTGSNEEEELLKTIAFIRKTLPATYRRLVKATRAYIVSQRRIKGYYVK